MPDTAHACEQCGARPVRKSNHLMLARPFLHGLALVASFATVLGSLVLFLVSIFAV